MKQVAVKQMKLESEKLHYTRANKGEWSKPKSEPLTAFSKKVVSLDENPVVVHLTESGLFLSGIVTTKGCYSITYNPDNSPKRIKDKPFTIGQDLIKGLISVSGPAHFKCLCKRIPELGFLKKWSNYDDRLFALAKKHPGIGFTFTLRWGDYADMIEKKAEDMGLDIDHKPFFAYITTKDQLDALREKYRYTPRYKQDIQAVLDEVDKEMK